VDSSCSYNSIYSIYIMGRLDSRCTQP